MKLGKALATGYAEERPRGEEAGREEIVREEVVREERGPLAEDTARVVTAEPGREEVPAVR
ncbi:hypothetical protein [Streptomyces sp. NBC_00557]|uniref:hypothetical protein n=1 Tax=Streptomyces sp. NBC_00557 TaxID=2975776 RepID=UPI002E8188DD|nr:hypothetical protein [Streptomyces sp. NBC_00557]WUC37785.1 hypothetical protein OG956_27955 [Streptomyces sp. NBC_00557]